jgi:hypothetical protein
MSLCRFRCFFLFFGGALIGGCAYVALAFGSGRSAVSCATVLTTKVLDIYRDQ